MYAIPDLPPSLARELYAELCSSLPPPVLDTPEAIEARNEFAMATLAALGPTDAFEARLALRVVLTDAQASYCLRLAVQHAGEFAEATRCRAQACSMMRQSQNAHRTLLQTQAGRLGSMLPAAPVFRRAVAAPPQPELVQPPAAHPGAPVNPPPGSPLALAEEFAQAHPMLAAEVRVSRGITREIAETVPPGRLPGDPAVLAALIDGDTVFLRMLGEVAAEAMKDAA